MTVANALGIFYYSLGVLGIIVSCGVLIAFIVNNDGGNNEGKDTEI